jgi:hypothetical protein
METNKQLMDKWIVEQGAHNCKHGRGHGFRKWDVGLYGNKSFLLV